MNALVTGGAGYIGAHMVRALGEAGHSVVVVDNLSSGHADAVPKGITFLREDVSAQSTMTQVLKDFRVDAVFHFASRIQVGESVLDPRLYYRDNLAAAISLLESTLAAKVGTFVLSSTAAIYGNPLHTPIGCLLPADYLLIISP